MPLNLSGTIRIRNDMAINFSVVFADPTDHWFVDVVSNVMNCEPIWFCNDAGHFGTVLISTVVRPELDGITVLELFTVEQSRGQTLPDAVEKNPVTGRYCQKELKLMQKPLIWQSSICMEKKNQSAHI